MNINLKLLDQRIMTGKLRRSKFNKYNHAKHYANN